MSAEPSRHAWTMISLERFREYLDEAQRLVKLARDRDIHPFAAAIAGVSFIHMACTVMKGDLRWWVEFVRTGTPPGLDMQPPRADG